MDTMTILQQELMAYAQDPINGKSYLTLNRDENVFVIVSIANVREEHIAEADLIVRCDEELIIIEHDINDKPLVDALVQAGIPRAKIILAYAGETFAPAGEVFLAKPPPK